MSLKKRVAVNIAANWAGFVVQGGVALLLIPFVLRQVGTDAYGVWALLAGLLSYFQILQSAFSLAINRFAAFYRSDISQVNHYFAVALYSMLGLGVVVVLLAVAASFLVCTLFAIPAHLEYQARMTCVLVGVNVALIASVSVILGLLNGFQMYVATNVVTIVASLVRITVVFWILASMPSIAVLQACYCLSSAVSLTLALLVAILVIPGLRFLTWPRREVWREMFRYTRHSLARSGSNVFMYATLLLLVGWFGTLRDVTIYAIASKIPQLIRGALSSAQSVFLPAFSTLFASQGAGGIVRIVRQATRLNAALTFAIVALCLAYAEPLLKVWLRDGYEPQAVLPMMLLLLSNVPRGTFELWLAALVAMGILWPLTVAAAVTCFGTILIAALLAPAIGAPNAAALALLASLTLKSAIWLPIYGTRCTGIGAAAYLRETLLRPAAALAIAIAILAAALAIYPPPARPIPLLVHGGILSVTVAIVMAAVVLPEATARYLKAMARLV